jgi:hypothetical protein
LKIRQYDARGKTDERQDQWLAESH